jgi:hypothetical protein
MDWRYGSNSRAPVLQDEPLSSNPIPPKKRWGKGNITINTNKIQKITREYFKIVYSKKLKKLKRVNL